jgi:hypothetical protein
VETLGMKLAFCVAEFCDVFAFTSVLYIKNKWGLMASLSVSGVPFGFAVSIPYTITGLAAPKNKAGVYIGALNIFIEVGSQAGLYAFQTGLGSLFEERYPTIAAGGFAAILGMICSYFLIVPKQCERSDSESGNREVDEKLIGENMYTEDVVDVEQIS